jgi:hypothetical protein
MSLSIADLYRLKKFDFVFKRDILILYNKNMLWWANEINQNNQSSCMDKYVLKRHAPYAACLFVLFLSLKA